MAADLVQLTRASMQTWNQHDLEGYLADFDDEACYIGPRRRVDGIADIRRYMAMLMEAFPDEHVVVNRTARDGDTVFVQYSDTATHSGVMRWSAHRLIEPTGRRFSYEGVTEIRFVDDKIVYARDYFDLYELLFLQLGFPMPQQSASAG